jgi:hypothetical protein
MRGLKKHRGLKRYYKNLAIKNDLEKINWLDFNKHYGYWHLHFDWRGYGNNSFQRRKPHLDKLFRHFDILVEETKSLKIEFQLYIMLLDFHSANDSLFLHPPEPNNSQFSFKVSDLKSTTTLKNKSLNEYIDHLLGYEKMYGPGGDEAFCLLLKKNVGQPF